MSNAANFPPTNAINKPNQFQKTLFPFDAFSADDPNVTASPKLTLNSLWTLVATFIGNITGFASKNAPQPQSAAGVGQWELIQGTDDSNLSLPAGGTWAYFVFRTVTSSGACFTGSAAVGIASGGTVIIGALATYTPYALVWRIA